MKYTKEILSEAIAESSSIASVLRKLGIKPSGGSYRHISGLIRSMGISIDHFKGKAWNSGLSKETSESVRKQALLTRRTDDDVFIENSMERSGHRLKSRLKNLGWDVNTCSNCGLNEWLGMPLTLHLDHINGINNDNRLENLRFLCPNCHQQTETWGNRKKTAL